MLFKRFNLIEKYDLAPKIVAKISEKFGKYNDYKGIGIIWDTKNSEKVFEFIDHYSLDFAKDDHYIFVPNFFYGLVLVKTKDQFELIKKSQFWGASESYTIDQIINLLKNLYKWHKFRFYCLGVEHLGIHFFKKMTKKEAYPIVEYLTKIFEYSRGKTFHIQEILKNNTFSIRT